MRQQVALQLRSQVQVALQRGSFRLVQVVQAVLHQRIGEQAVLLHRVVALQAQTVGAFGHAVQRRIHFVQEIRQRGISRRGGKGRLQPAFAILQLSLQEPNLWSGHEISLTQGADHSILPARPAMHVFRPDFPDCGSPRSTMENKKMDVQPAQPRRTLWIDEAGRGNGANGARSR